MKNIALFLLIFIMACSSTKNAFTEQQINNLETVVKNKQLELNFDWANPLATSSVNVINALLPPGNTAGNISLIGNANHLIINKDSLDVDLPYFGERQLNGGYGNVDNGINHIGKLLEESLSYDEKKKAYTLKFRFIENQESYRAILTLYPNKKSYISINSSHRTIISYTGYWKALKDKISKP